LFPRHPASNPIYAAAYYNLGNVLRDQEKLDEAIAAFSAAARLNPRDAMALNNLANALKKQGKVPESVDAYSSSIALLRPTTPRS